MLEKISVFCHGIVHVASIREMFSKTWHLKDICLAGMRYLRDIRFTGWYIIQHAFCFFVFFFP